MNTQHGIQATWVCTLLDMPSAHELSHTYFDGFSNGNVTHVWCNILISVSMHRPMYKQRCLDHVVP